MKSKTIRKVFKEKINDWLRTIKDEDVREDIRESCIITGGAVASLLLGEEVNDYDIYFTNKATVLAVAKYYTNMLDMPVDVVDDEDRVRIVIHSEGVVNVEEDGGLLPEDVIDAVFEDEVEGAISIRYETLEPEEKIDNPNRLKFKDGVRARKYMPVFVSGNAITLSDDLQLIIRFYGEPDEIHSNYDFVHCTNYWSSGSDELVLRPEALESLLTKELIYIGSKYPLSSVIRTRKFIQRDFHCSAGQFLKMCWQVSQLDLSDVSVLEDQLIGVDVAYFQELIHKLKTGDRAIDYSYMAELVEEIF